MASLPPQQNCCAKLCLHAGDPNGHYETIANLKCYVTENYSKDSEKFLLIFPDIFGIQLKNTQLVADTFAKQLNYPVIIIDILNNDPYNPNNSLDFNSWFSNHQPEFTINLIKDWMTQFKLIFKNVKFLSGIGYCFGAKYLSHYLNDSNIISIDVGCFAHPSFVTDDELKNINKPLILSCAETDEIFTKDLRYKSEEILQLNKIPYQFDLYSQTSHGFAVRGDLSIPQVKYAAEKALSDQIIWFKHFEK
jgi:dienelactone hydrolase